VIDACRPADGRPRCWWTGDAATADPAMARYHDDEWGLPVVDDTELFERLTLECFQAGLSWSTILRKRDGFRRAFAGFDPAAVAAFDEADRARLLADAGIVRNRAKVDATIGNATAFLAVVAEHGSFATWLGAVVGRAPGVPAPPLPAGTTFADLAPTTPASDALSADLRRRGFRFVGPTVVYAFMESVGLVDDHLPGCWRYRG
jgi:DNA-3-methyladenine glycosylase I